MTPHEKGQQHSILEMLYNNKHKHGQYVVENAFGILKKTFMELTGIIELDVRLVPNVLTCYYLLHNLILGK
jgi:hypothetical protein